MNRIRKTLWLFPLAALVAVGLVVGASGPNERAELGPLPEGLERATFAGGCFWCMEPPFDRLDGVVSTTSGYTGGEEPDPTYRDVSYGRTGHAEAVEVRYDPAKISYAQLLDVFWKNIDPTTPNRQFCDGGSQYRTAIYAHGEEQLRLALESKAAIEESGILGVPIVTEIESAGTFYPAEEYHQDFYLKNPEHYKRYRTGCGRDRALERIWGAAPAKN